MTHLEEGLRGDEGDAGKDTDGVDGVLRGLADASLGQSDH